MLVIAFTGIMGSGKDTAASYIVEKLSEDKKIRVAQFKLYQPLRDILHKLMGKSYGHNKTDVLVISDLGYYDEVKYLMSLFGEDDFVYIVYLDKAKEANVDSLSDLAVTTVPYHISIVNNFDDQFFNDLDRMMEHVLVAYDNYLKINTRSEK